MKHKTIILMLLLAATSCDRFSVADRVFENSVYLDVSAFDRIQTATFSNTVDVAVKELSVKLSYPADKDISATISVDDPGDRTIIGNNQPRYNYGINLSVQYFGFDFGIFFQGVGT